jgi:hypothetical protein
MKKFDGILLCTDLDDTLLTTDKKVSEENTRAIEYFKSEGGLFTFATGRVPHGAKLMLEYVHPNAPMVCFNGGSIYDFTQNKMLWSRSLDKGAVKVVEFVEKNFDFAGIEICTEENIYFSKTNRIVEEHKVFEKLPDKPLDHHLVKEAWKKVIFMVETDQMPQLRSALSDADFFESYAFVQSSPWYYELLPKNSSKGEGLMQLADLLDIDRSRTIAVGDNENDVMMVKMAGKGIAVANAIDEIKNNADIVLSADNNSSAIAAVISMLDSGEIVI